MAKSAVFSTMGHMLSIDFWMISSGRMYFPSSFDEDLAETIHPADNSGNLNEDERLLLEILKEKRQLSSGELFELYKQSSFPARGERSFRNYMEDLCSKGLVKAVGTNRWREYEIAKPNNNEKQ